MKATRIIKNQPARIEYGEMDNFATFTPLELIESEKDITLIKFRFSDEVRTIELWVESRYVDMESFA